MTWKHRVVIMLRKLGYDLNRYEPNRSFAARLMRLMEVHNIGLVLDVGANRGQYAVDLRECGYRGRIVSFEPLPTAYADLNGLAAPDRQWEARRMALGAEPGRSIINVAGNSTSSSLLGMLPAHENAAPTSRYVGTEEIEVATLDSLWQTLGSWKGEVWLKIDTQGYEAEVIKGASGVLTSVSCVQLEMSLVPLYDGAEDFLMLLRRMNELGYKLIGLEPGFCDNRTGRLLQVDGIFHRE